MWFLCFFLASGFLAINREVEMKILIWTAVSIALITFVVNTAFLAVVTAKRARDEGRWIPLETKATAYFWLFVGVPADALFNITRGSWIFKELPRLREGEWMFSSRVQRWVIDGVQQQDWTRYQTAKRWAVFLNVDPEHIDYDQQ